MANEGTIQIDDEGNSNQEKKNSADSENIPEEFTEKLVIKKGKGTALKDICNVVSELEKKTLSFSEALHCILYGENDEVEGYKKDVLEFSGFVSDDEECQRDKVQERLERCTRDMLLQLFSVFDISVEIAFYAMKKKEIIELLLDFMEAPYDATEEAESSDREIPSRKRKPMTTEDTSTSKRIGSIDKDPSEKIREMVTGTSLEIVHEEENKEKDDNAASNEPEEMRGFEKEENITTFENPKDSGTKMAMNESSRGDRSFDLNANSSSEKLTKSVWELEKSMKMQKHTERRVAQGGDEQPKEWCDPSYEEVQKAISIILEETDITTATFSDILEELDDQFEMDISPRKDAIMVMIEEELYRLADETQEHESREENQQENEGTQDGNEDNCTQVPCEVPVQSSNLV